MSGRLFRKVLKEQEQNQNQGANVNAEVLQENLEDDESDLGAPSINPFDLLNDDDDYKEYDQDDESSAVDDGLEEFYRSGPLAKSHVHAVPSSNKKSKKKKKKKNKDILSSNTDGAEKLKDIEALSLEIDSAQAASSSKKISIEDFQVNDTVVKQSKSSILKVDPKSLNAENELRRIFGSKVVSQFEKTNQASISRQGRGGPGGRRGQRGGYAHRKCLLVSPSDHWPRWDGSLSMELLESKNGNNYFRYVQSDSYSQAHRSFEAAKAIHDLNGVASILMYNPYHVESLMTLADYFRFSGEHQMAADSVAKCLYALECAWHPMFSPLQDNCRLEYSHETNKPLFSTLFIHMKNLDKRGCHRSALEVCKLLLSLDPADPMGALFCIDYFALRAEEYAWLEQFSEEYRSDNSLWNFPNFAYSLAVCRFCLERESLKDSKVEHDKETSFDLMKQALMLHPPVLKRLVEKVPLKDQVFATMTKNPFFKAEDTGIPSVDHLIRIYVERSYLVWRLPDIQKLLKDAALQVVETLKHKGSEANTWACVRKESFPSEKNEYGHLLVSDFSDVVPTMPPDNLQNFMMVNPQMREMVENQNQGAQEHVREPRELANRNPLAVLFESLLPWVDYGTEEAGNQNPDDGQH